MNSLLWFCKIEMNKQPQRNKVTVDFRSLFKNAVAKFVLNIPNYVTKFGILRGNLESQISKLLNKVLKYYT